MSEDGIEGPIVNSEFDTVTARGYSLDRPEESEQETVNGYNSSHLHKLLIRDGEYRPNVLKSAYTGALKEVFRSIENSNETKSVEDKLFMPPRIVRGIIDARIEDSSIPLEIYLDAIDVLKKIYKNEQGSKQVLQQLHKNIKEGYPQVLDRKIEQKPDGASVHAGDPKFTKRTVDSINNVIDADQAFLLIPMAHGGVSTGMDVFLGATDGDNAHKDSEILPIRFSRNKMKDTEPHIDSEMRGFIEQQVKMNKPIILYEEDRNTGETMIKAKEYFKKTFPDAEIHDFFNRDNFDDW